MRHLLIGSVAACLAVACMATPVEAQRNAADNPYPQTLTPTAAQTATKTARAKFHVDSLRAEYPVSSKSEPCWRYSEPDKVTNGDAYFCYRDRGETLNTALQWGALRTFYRGKWGNVVAVWTNAPTPAARLTFDDESQRAITFGLDSAKTRH
jgi:hypothetical protein